MVSKTKDLLRKRDHFNLDELTESSKLLYDYLRRNTWQVYYSWRQKHNGLLDDF